MKGSPHRRARVAEAIRESASETVLFKLRDPRVKMVTVTRAEVSADMQHAKVYVSIMGTDQEQRACLKGLQHAAGFVQKQLADRLRMRFTPAIVFTLDKGVKNSLDIARLLREEGPALASEDDEDAAGLEPEIVSEDEPFNMDGENDSEG